MSLRQTVVDAIAPMLPDTWRVQPYSDEPDVLDRVTVMVTSSRIDPGATAHSYSVEMHVYVLVPNRNDALRDSDDVDDAVLETLDAVLRLRAVIQGTAERATFQGGHPCWDITINIQASVADAA